MGAASVERDEMVRQAARADDPDRYVAALLAPRAIRSDLVTLAAFAGAVLKIPYQVTDAQIGEIRVAWWREAILEAAQPVATGNPVADAFAEVFQRRGLDGRALEALFDQVVDRVYSTPIDDLAALSRDIDATQGTLFRFARAIAGGATGAPQEASAAFAAAIEAYGLAQACLMLPYDLARGHSPLPGVVADGDADFRPVIAGLRTKARDALCDLRSARHAMLDADFTVLLPVALVEPYFEALSAAKHNPARDVAEISPLARVWGLAKARVLGRL